MFSKLVAGFVGGSSGRDALALAAVLGRAAETEGTS
jgi:hypothetical protein